MKVNHEIPKCPKCGRFMKLDSVLEDDVHGDEYKYICDEEDSSKCTNNKPTIIVEGKN